MNEKPKRAKRHQRQDPPPPMRMTERDIAVLEAVYQYRVLSQVQIQRLLFTDLNPNVAQRRLFLLYHNGYLERQFLPTTGGVMTSPVLYMLDKMGGEYLLQHSHYTEIRWKSSDNQVGYLHLQHLLNINTFRIEMMLASSKYKCPIETWVDDTTSHQNYDRVRIANVADPVAVIPDGYFRIGLTNSKPMHFFLELDRGNMDLKRFKQKLLAYSAYAKSGLSQQRFNTEKFRVLTVTLDTTRMESLRQGAEDIGGENRFWFGVLEELSSDKILSEAVWWLPKRQAPVPLINPSQLVE